jgi:desulfoferrodoxin-like iron-binding protein
MSLTMMPCWMPWVSWSEVRRYRGIKIAEKLQIYKCELCGNIVEVLHGGKGELYCCDQPMERFVENTVDAALDAFHQTGGRCHER